MHTSSGRGRPGAGMEKCNAKPKNFDYATISLEIGSINFHQRCPPKSDIYDFRLATFRQFL